MPPKEVKPELTTIEKLPFHSVRNVFDALFDAFHPEGFEDGVDLNPTYLALMQVFLTTAGWTHDEFWKTMDEGPDTCPHCGGEMCDENDLDGEIEKLPDLEKKVVSTEDAKSKPN